MLCCLCGEKLIWDALRLQIGFIEYRKRGETFMPDSFSSGDTDKWLCDKCSSEVGCHPSTMHQDHCVYCGAHFDPSEAVLMVERGELRSSHHFSGMSGGLVHYICAEDELNLGLWQE